MLDDVFLELQIMAMRDCVLHLVVRMSVSIDFSSMLDEIRIWESHILSTWPYRKY